MGNNTIRRMCLDGVLIGLFLVFGLLRIRVGAYLEIGLGTIVIVIAAISLGLWDAVAIAALGEFMNQIFFSGYGLTPTTPLWVLPVVVRALIIGVVAALYRRKGDSLVKHKVLYFVTILGAALVISGLDTAILYLDGIIMGYPVAYTWAQTGIRFLTSQITAIIVAILTIPLHNAVSYLLPAKNKKAEASDASAQK